jgi:hypothetical protein
MEWRVGLFGRGEKALSFGVAEGALQVGQFDGDLEFLLLGGLVFKVLDDFFEDFYQFAFSLVPVCLGKKEGRAQFFDKLWRDESAFLPSLDHVEESNDEVFDMGVGVTKEGAGNGCGEETEDEGE